MFDGDHTQRNSLIICCNVKSNMVAAHVLHPILWYVGALALLVGLYILKPYEETAPSSTSITGTGTFQICVAGACVFHTL